jgi:hypothetical protein
MAVLGTGLTVHVNPSPERLAGFQGRTMEFAAIMVRAFIGVQNLKRLRWLAEPVQFARHQVLRTSRKPHPRIPSYAV